MLPMMLLLTSPEIITNPPGQTVGDR